MRGHRVLVALACIAAGTVGAPPVAAGCAAVRTQGAWTFAAAPSFVTTTTGGTQIDSDQVTHFSAWLVARTAQGGLPSRSFVTNGARLFRTVDSGCTWRGTYGTDTAADPQSVVATQHPQYMAAAIATRRIAPGAHQVTGRDVGYVLFANHDSFAGVPQNLAGQPYLLARSTDGGVAWRTDVLRAALPGAPEPTPVLGDGITMPTAIVSPADPRVGYLLLDARDPRSVDETRTFGALYVTRDLGATWSYATPLDPYSKIAADPTDPNVLYNAAAGRVQRVTLGPTTTRTRLHDLAGTELVGGIDVVHPPHGPARILVTTLAWDDRTNMRSPRLHYSADGGRTWRVLVVSLPFAGTFDNNMVGDQAWVLASGDLVGFADVGGGGGGRRMTLLLRWDARRRAWRKPVPQSLPLPSGYVSDGLDYIEPVDIAHRFLAVGGSGLDSTGQHWKRVVGVWDSAR